VPVDTYFQVPLDIQLQGTFYQLEKFFASLDPNSSAALDNGIEDDRVITIENLRLTPGEVKDREIMLLASFTTSTYRQDAAAAPAAPATPAPAPATKPAAAGSATGSTAGSGSAVTPLTPIKEEVDDAMAAD